MGRIVAPVFQPVHPRDSLPQSRSLRVIIKSFVTLEYVKGSLKYLLIYHDILNERAG